MKLLVNGSEREVRATRVDELVAELGLPVGAALVELNGIALLRTEWSTTPLQTGDRLEIIRMVAGG